MSPLSIFILKFMINLIIKLLNMCSLVNHQQKEGINVITLLRNFFISMDVTFTMNQSFFTNPHL